VVYKDVKMFKKSNLYVQISTHSFNSGAKGYLRVNAA